MILTSSPSAKYAVIHEVLNRDDNIVTITALCEIAGVSRSGYYKWINSTESREQREKLDKADFALILDAYQFRGYDKGIRGIYMRLLRLDPPVVMNRKKISRLMRKFGLFCPIRKPNPYRQLQRRLQTSKTVPNLLNREFKAHGARTVLLTDITYIPRNNGKYSYLSVIMDAFTKEVLAHVCSLSLDVDFVLETVNQMLEKHGSELKTDSLIHSDQGCHYTSHKFADLINDNNIRRSMSRRANCWDNAPQESFFGHMKAEIRLKMSDGHAEIARRINDWIDYYSNDRYQWGLAKLSPTEYFAYVTTGVYPLANVISDHEKDGDEDDPL